MNFFNQLEGPELKQPSLHDEPEIRSTGFKPLPVTQPQTSWYAAPAPDGSGDFTPFKFSKLTAVAIPNQRRFGPNDENPAG